MKRFPFVVLRKSALAAIHQRSKTLDSVNHSLSERLEAHMSYEKRLEERIQMLMDKCSRVGLSKLENEIVRLNEVIGVLTEGDTDG